MEILEYIPFGKEKAVSREHLTMMTGLNDRVCRKLIQKAREEGARVMSSSQQAGYWIAENEEEWERFCKEQERRIRSIVKVLRRKEEVKGQERL